MGKAPLLFHEEQAFRRWPAALVLAIPPIALLVITLRQVVWGHPWGNPPASNGGLIFLTILLSLVYMRLITVRLVTDLRAKQLAMRFQGLWIRRKISLEDVRGARTVEYDPVRDFGGYGIRSGARGQAYIASGTSGVELKMKDGRKILIGSQDAGRLVREIEGSRSQF